MLVVGFIVDRFLLLEGDTVLEELPVEIEFEELDALLTVEELVELVLGDWDDEFVKLLGLLPELVVLLSTLALLMVDELLFVDVELLLGNVLFFLTLLSLSFDYPF